MPSTDSPWSFWYALIAATVFLPQMPSAPVDPQEYPAAISFRCSSLTSSPLLPCLMFRAAVLTSSALSYVPFAFGTPLCLFMSICCPLTPPRLMQ